MRIQQKLWLSNLAMVLVPACLSLLCLLWLFGQFGNRYWLPLEKMFQENNAAYSAQSLLYAYSEDIFGYDWAQHSASEQAHHQHAMAEQSTLMSEVKDELLRMGYHFAIQKNGNLVYDNLEDHDRDVLAGLVEQSKNATKVVMSTAEVSFIKNTLTGSAGSIEIFVLSHLDEQQDNTSYLQKYITRFIALFLLFVLGVVAIMGAVLARFHQKMFLTPLLLLEKATREISAGNLEVEISYDKADEFGTVCASFNDMRLHLQEAVQERLTHEAHRKQLIADISHDLRTPLTMIRGYSEGLLDGIAKTEEKRQHYLHAIHDKALHMEVLVQQLATLSNLERAGFAYHFAPVDIGTYLQSWFAQNQHHESLSLTYENQLERPCVLPLDKEAFGRVLENILENSLKYKTASKVALHLTLSLMGEAVELRLTDDGAGVPEEALHQIFTRFYRSDQARSNPSQGSGLGLAIAKQIVLGHKGEIFAKNDRGLCIIIHLPIQT